MKSVGEQLPPLSTLLLYKAGELLAPVNDVMHSVEEAVDEFTGTARAGYLRDVELENREGSADLDIVINEDEIQQLARRFVDATIWQLDGTDEDEVEQVLARVYQLGIHEQFEQAVSDLLPRGQRLHLFARYSNRQIVPAILNDEIEFSANRILLSEVYQHGERRYSSGDNLSFFTSGIASQLDLSDTSAQLMIAGFIGIAILCPPLGLAVGTLFGVYLILSGAAQIIESVDSLLNQNDDPVIRQNAQELGSGITNVVLGIPSIFFGIRAVRSIRSGGIGNSPLGRLWNRNRNFLNRSNQTAPLQEPPPAVASGQISSAKQAAQEPLAVADNFRIRNGVDLFNALLEALVDGELAFETTVLGRRLSVCLRNLRNLNSQGSFRFSSSPVNATSHVTADGIQFAVDTPSYPRIGLADIAINGENHLLGITQGRGGAILGLGSPADETFMFSQLEFTMEGGALESIRIATDVNRRSHGFTLALKQLVGRIAPKIDRVILRDTIPTHPMYFRIEEAYLGSANNGEFFIPELAQTSGEIWARHVIAMNLLNRAEISTHLQRITGQGFFGFFRTLGYRLRVKPNTTFDLELIFSSEGVPPRSTPSN